MLSFVGIGQLQDCVCLVVNVMIIQLVLVEIQILFGIVCSLFNNVICQCGLVNMGYCFY